MSENSLKQVSTFRKEFFLTLTEDFVGEIMRVLMGGRSSYHPPHPSTESQYDYILAKNEFSVQEIPQS